MRIFLAGDLTEHQQQIFMECFYDLDGAPYDKESSSPWGCPWIYQKGLVLRTLDDGEYFSDIGEFEIEQMAISYAEDYIDEWQLLEIEKEYLKMEMESKEAFGKIKDGVEENHKFFDCDQWTDEEKKKMKEIKK